MSHANRQLAQRWMQEVWNERRDATVDELLPAHAVGHAADASRIRGPAESVVPEASPYSPPARTSGSRSRLLRMKEKGLFSNG